MANCGSHAACRRETPRCAQGAEVQCTVPRMGFLLNGLSTRMDDMTDGLGRTFAVGESGKPAPRRDWDSDPSPHDAWSYGYATSGGTWVAMGHKADANAENAFGSAHEGGAHFLFADGTVTFISENIDFGVYQALSTIAAGDVVDDSSF